MYVCMYVRTYEYTYVRMYVGYSNECTCLYVYVFTDICGYICIYARLSNMEFARVTHA